MYIVLVESDKAVGNGVTLLRHRVHLSLGKVGANQLDNEKRRHQRIRVTMSAGTLADTAHTRGSMGSPFRTSLATLQGKKKTMY